MITEVDADRSRQSGFHEESALGIPTRTAKGSDFVAATRRAIRSAVDEERKRVWSQLRRLEALVLQLQSEDDPIVMARLAAAALEAPQLASVDAQGEVSVMGESPVTGESPVAGESPVSPRVVETTLHVTGLSGSAAIAGYRWQLSALEGVAAATVYAATDREVTLRVTHLPNVPMEQAVGRLTWFSADVTRSAPGQVWVTVRSPMEALPRRVPSAEPLPGPDAGHVTIERVISVLSSSLSTFRGQPVPARTDPHLR